MFSKLISVISRTQSSCKIHLLANSQTFEMSLKLFSVLSLMIIAIFFEQSAALKKVGDSCDFENVPGKCKLPSDCQSFDSENSEQNEKFVQTKCGYLPDMRTMIICCPVPPKRMKCSASQAACNRFKARQDKTFRALEDHIFGGVNASLDDFPQFAALAYQQNNRTKPQFICGGVLISKKFVLTAAHCIKVETPVTFVRLGTTHLYNREWSTDVKVKVGKRK